MSAVLTEHAELVIKVNETRPREGVTFDGLAHGIGGLEFVGNAEHVQVTMAVLVVDGDDVAGVADAGRTPRGPTDDERQLVLVVFTGDWNNDTTLQRGSGFHSPVFCRGSWGRFFLSFQKCDFLPNLSFSALTPLIPND